MERRQQLEPHAQRSGRRVFSPFGFPPAEPSLSAGTLSLGTLHVRGVNFEISGGLLSVGRLDLSGGTVAVGGGGAVRIDHDGSTSAASIRPLIGSRIVSSSATPGVGIAYADATAIPAVPPVFGTVDDTTVVMLMRRFGDADLDRTVDLDDFNRLAVNFGQSGRLWTDGDFDYNGVVNLVDFNRLAANFGLAASGPDVSPDDWAALASAIPEPGAGLATMAAMTAELFARRRRRGGC